ncbi:MAG: hypothetical protein J6V04_04740 [Bacteroidales bacterium]|nr:hypothetical protein [Bacteroidales bacterium]
MKYIKISLAVAALLTLFVSCTKRSFEPVLGDTKVQFVNTSMEISLTGQYHFVPIQMVEQSSTSALATVELVSAVATLPDGSTREIVEREKTDTVAAEIIFTSKEVYIGPYDSTVDGTGLPYNNLEFRLPYYRDYQSVALEFRLVGTNVAENSTCTYVAEKASGVVIEGVYTFTSNYWPESPTDVAFTKESDSKYWFVYATDNGDISAQRDGNTLIFSLTDYVDYNGLKLQMCQLLDDGYYPDTPVQITFDNAGFVLDNGMFYGDFEAGSGYILSYPGATGVKK